ncbi:hypothetical protein [Streptomyces tibetensis]|uniref:Squalene cyclase C-terminal domain-containing protein n=1 Tax=Streptomyces tibetensis TaxID=2382123 RepID=A0ABW6MLH7_9ACTN
MSVWSEADLTFVRDRARRWDLHNSERFWGGPLYDLVEPLLGSFNCDFGVPKQIGTPSESLPETTATVLLALHRMGLLNASMRQRIQAYLWSTHYALAAGIDEEAKYPDAECWSSVSRNVWATATSLWALIATGYRGRHEGRYAPAVRWLVDAQDEDGAWGFSRDAQNPPSVFLTSVCAYTLRMTAARLDDVTHEIHKASVQCAVDAAVGYLKRTRRRRSGLWQTDSGETEPTSSAMALWALRRCGSADDGELVRSGVRALSKTVGNGRCAASLEIAAGTLPDSREAIALQGYTPAIPLALLQIDVDPFHKMILQPLHFLRTSRRTDGWEFPVMGNARQGRYLKAVPYVGTGEALTFTTALALQTAHAWHRRVISWTIEQRLTKP